MGCCVTAMGGEWERKNLAVNIGGVFGHCRLGFVLAARRCVRLGRLVEGCVRKSRFKGDAVYGLCFSAPSCLLVERSVRGPICGRGLELHDCNAPGGSSAMFTRLGGGCGSIICGHEVNVDRRSTVGFLYREGPIGSARVAHRVSCFLSFCGGPGPVICLSCRQRTFFSGASDSFEVAFSHGVL